MRYLPALVVDAVLVLVFAAIGRASHSEDPLGFLLTAWPFLVALVVGHALAALVPARPRRPWSLGWGLIVWIVTVAGGMLLRIASGDTAEVPFIIVATLVIGAFLVGWRLVAMLVRRRRPHASASAASASAASDIDAPDSDAPDASDASGAPDAPEASDESTAHDEPVTADDSEAHDMAAPHERGPSA